MDANINELNIWQNQESYYSQSWKVRELSDIERELQENIEKEKQETIQVFKNYLENRFWDRFLEDMYRFDFDYVNGKLLWLNRWEIHWFFKYTESNWPEFYMSLSWLKWSDFFEFWLKESWHEYKDWELIPQFLKSWDINPKYIEALDNINFYDDIQVFYGILKALRNWRKPEWYTTKDIEMWIVSWVVRIKDLMEYKWDWETIHSLIPDEDFPKLLIRAIQELPNQCSDMRFYENASGERMNFEVTKQELDQYLNPKSWESLITKSVYDDCLRRIEARDKKIEDRKRIENETRWGLIFEKETLTTKERIDAILRGDFK